MFVLLKGATKEQAFRIGNEIAEAVTATNPKPVKLKFEKVMALQSTALFQEDASMLLWCDPKAAVLPGVPAVRASDQEAVRGLHVREPGPEGAGV